MHSWAYVSGNVSWAVKVKHFWREGATDNVPSLTIGVFVHDDFIKVSLKMCKNFNNHLPTVKINSLNCKFFLIL